MNDISGTIHNKGNKVPVALVDIDETICFYNGDRIYEKAIPNTTNINKINRLHDSGWKVIYWTSRGSARPNDAARFYYIANLTKKQLKEWGAKHSELILGDSKPLFDLVVDDKAKRIEEL